MVVSRPLVVEGHLVPTNSHIIPNIYAIHMDPASWPQPELFNPARFLVTSDNGEVRVVKPKAFVPFGVGQRMCLFDRLAEAELQLFFASIIHVFDIEGQGFPEIFREIDFFRISLISPISQIQKIHQILHNKKQLIFVNKSWQCKGKIRFAAK